MTKAKSMGGLGIRGSSDIYHYEKGVHYLQLADWPTESLALTRCGYHECPPGHSWGPKFRPQYHMHFIIDGSGTLESNGTTYHLSKGQIFLLPPNVVSCYYADYEHPWHYAFACFLGTQAERYLKKAGFSEDVVVRECNLAVDTFTACIDEMLDAHQLTMTNELKRTASLYKLLALLIDSNIPQGTSAQKQQYDYSSQTYLDHALQFIHFNFERNIQIPDIANYVGITHSYLFQIFKQNLNTSPKDYLLHYRMEHAKHLLETTDIPVKSIASSVGYIDPLTFSKMFSNVVGVPPHRISKKFRIRRKGKLIDFHLTPNSVLLFNHIFF